MKVSFPLIYLDRVDGFPGGGVLTIDELDEIVRAAFHELGSDHHPADAHRYLQLSCERYYAPTGRCSNCRHYWATMEDCGAPPEILGDHEFDGDEGDWSPCRFWEPDKENDDACH